MRISTANWATPRPPATATRLTSTCAPTPRRPSLFPGWSPSRTRSGSACARSCGKKRHKGLAIDPQPPPRRPRCGSRRDGAHPAQADLGGPPYRGGTPGWSRRARRPARRTTSTQRRTWTGPRDGSLTSGARSLPPLHQASTRRGARYDSRVRERVTAGNGRALRSSPQRTSGGATRRSASRRLDHARPRSLLRTRAAGRLNQRSCCRLPSSGR